MTPTATLGVTVAVAYGDGTTDEMELIEVLGLVDATAEYLDINHLGPVVIPAGPFRVTVTATARRVNVSRGLFPLDARLMRLIADMSDEQRADAGSALTFIREAWRGGDYYTDVAEALQVIEDYAGALRRLLSGEGQETITTEESSK